MKEQIEATRIFEVRRVGGGTGDSSLCNPDKLQYHNLDLNQVTRAISAENTNIPGGTIEMGPTKYLVRVPGEFETPMEINEALVAVSEIRCRFGSRIWVELFLPTSFQIDLA